MLGAYEGGYVGVRRVITQCVINGGAWGKVITQCVINGGAWEGG